MELTLNKVEWGQLALQLGHVEGFAARVYKGFILDVVLQDKPVKGFITATFNDDNGFFIENRKKLPVIAQAVKRAMTTGEVARELGVSPKTVRKYTVDGLLPVSFRLPSGYARYNPETVKAFRAALEAKSQK